jgi:hypothetical protein
MKQTPQTTPGRGSQEQRQEAQRQRDAERETQRADRPAPNGDKRK